MADTAGTIDNLDIRIRSDAESAEDEVSGLSESLSLIVNILTSISIAIRPVEKAVKDTTSAAHKATGALSKMVRAIGRIAIYRAIRTAIKNVSAAIREGLANLYEYSQTVGTAFAPAVDNLKRHVLLLKNAFATALRPAIEAIIPVIINLVDKLAEAADFVAQVTSLLFGKVDENGRYTKAVLSDLEDSNKEAKELRRTLLGFDEINRLDGDTGKSQSSGANLQFVQADVSDGARKVADFINSIDWKTIWDVLKTLLIVFGIMKGVDLIKNIATFIAKLGAGKTIILALIALFGAFGDKIRDWCKNAKSKVGEFFDHLADAKAQGWNAFMELLGDISEHVIDIVGTIAGIVYDLVHGDFKGALKGLIHLIVEVIRLVVDIVIGLVNIILGLVSDLVNAIQLGAQWVWNNAIQPAINWIVTAVKNVGVFFHNLWIDFRIAFNNALKWILERVNDILGAVESAINATINVMNDVLGTDIKPVELQIDTSSFDEKIDELESMKLPYIDQTVEFVGKWDEIKPVELKVNTKAIHDTLDNIENYAYKVVDNINKAVSGLGASVAAPSNNRSNGKNINIVQFASGGFPSAGSLFIAGEAGPEFVGSVGGTTGVWNSDQLIQGMYAAFAAALAANPQGGDIYLDGEVIYRNTVRRNNNNVRSTGRSAFLT